MQHPYPGYPYYPPYPGYPYYPAQPAPKLINTAPPPMPKLANGEELSQEQTQNLDLIMGVPLEVTVEIGRTRKRVQEILSFSKGSLVVLDKLAGDQVDLFVNGKCIARGDVVVVDDNFGIRVTEILKKPGIEELAQSK
ncbi:MAG: flagellar motor switch protein FliN, partial [Acutalibacter sp.]|nr:flagellar motor switch protein FliN [Acutalibacter sp.]